MNGSAADRLILEVAEPGGSAELAVHGPTGRIIERSRLTLPPGLHSLPVPRSGLATLSSLEGTA